MDASLKMAWEIFWRLVVKFSIILLSKSTETCALTFQELWFFLRIPKSLESFPLSPQFRHLDLRRFVSFDLCYPSVTFFQLMLTKIFSTPISFHHASFSGFKSHGRIPKTIEWASFSTCPTEQSSYHELHERMSNFNLCKELPINLIPDKKMLFQVEVNDCPIF